MTSLYLARLLSMLPCFCLALPLVGCDGDSSSTSGDTSSETTTTTGSGGSGGAGGAGGTGGETTTSSSSAGGSGGSGGASMYTVNFSYTPQWSGVTSVEIVGGFGKITDWTFSSPLVTLADDGSGTWTGSTELPAGKYPYMVRVVGDDDGVDVKRYVLDTREPITIACPPESPTANADGTNPCSQVTVPQSAPAPMHHITGKVVYGGQPIAGYLVRLESDETAFGPYMANRLTTKDDGTFDFEAPVGMFGIQVQHPTYQLLDDVQRDPLALKAYRRSVSSAFYVAMQTDLLDAEMEYADYDQLSPVMSATLPTTFQVTAHPNSIAVKAAVYGTDTGMGTTIGSDWWASPYGQETTIMWDGTFDTSSALEPAVTPGTPYFWGTYHYYSAGVGKTWRAQGMPEEIIWN